MSKKGNILYIVLCLLLCILPFAGMTVAETNSTTENRKMAELPELQKDGKWNFAYFQELGAYFQDHFAFRPQFVMADSVIQSKVFGVSNMDTVIVGEDGWLYYTSTLPDYLGTDVISEREIFNVANNISLMQQAVEARGAEFLVTVAPNKNSLYGENMPYYDEWKVSSEKNIDLVGRKLLELEVPYADLYSVFLNQKEILYLKKDSHWNEKGAVLAYNTILDTMEYEHETYETVENIRTKTEYGDLNKMMYPLAFEPEWNYSYEKELGYAYVTETESVEDAWIETANEKGTGSMLMFRDSFGNTLLPLMAEVFKKAYFSKAVPYNIEKYMDTYSPEYVIVEKVERNLSDFAKEPPVMTGPVIEIGNPEQILDTDTTLEIKECESDTGYWEISGMVDENNIHEDSRICINLILDGNVVSYEAFTVTTDEKDNGYKLFVPKKNLSADNIQVEVLTAEGENVQQVLSTEINKEDMVNGES
ncbi:MAG: hypothetical protein ACI4A3_12385 [Lachnospiraceae bacterium]